MTTPAWDPLKTSSTYTLSNNNLTMEVDVSGTTASTISDWSKTKGKWYFEIKFDARITSSAYQSFGVCNSSFGSSDRAALKINSVGPMASGRVYDDVADSGYYSTSSANFSIGDIIGCAFDVDSGEVWFSVNGVWIKDRSANAGQPSDGLYPSTTDGPTGEVFACLSGRYDGDVFTARFAEVDLTYSIPTGFSAIDSVSIAVTSLNTFEEPYNIKYSVLQAMEELYVFSNLVKIVEEPYALQDSLIKLIEESYVFSDPLVKLFEEKYNILFEVVNSIEELYPLMAIVINVIEEIFGLKISLTLTQWYGDISTPTKIINEYYDDSQGPLNNFSLRYDDVLLPNVQIVEKYDNVPLLIKYLILPYTDKKEAINSIYLPYNDGYVAVKNIIESYSDCIKALKVNTELYDLGKEAVLVMNENWSISEIALSISIQESYTLTALNPLVSTFEQTYYMVPELSIEPSILVSITINGIDIDFLSIDIDAGMDKYSMIGTIELASERDYVNSPLLGNAICTINGTDFILFIETRNKKRTNSGASWTIGLVSPTAKLDLPYSKTMVMSFANNIYASELVQQMADLQNITVDWQTVDWQIPSYAISANDETPISVIRKVVNSVGSIIQTKPNGDMLIISKYPLSPTVWESTVPSIVFSSESDIIEIDENIVINEGKNAFLITDQGSSTADITLMEINENDTTKTIRGFRIPFEDGPFELLTSGGTDISIVKDVNPIEANIPVDFSPNEEWEYVEFIDWVGTTQYPIYEIIDWEWVSDDMGAFQISENGTLTVIAQSDTLKESLLRIKYKTKYWKWTVRGPSNSHAQVFVPELVE